MSEHQIGHFKQVIKTESGELWTFVSMNEYMNYKPDPDFVPPKISRFKRWREKKAMAFWYKVHRLADDRGACDARCC